MPEIITEEFCSYNIVGISELLKNKKKITIEEIRLFVSKISVHDPTISLIATDCISIQFLFLQIALNNDAKPNPKIIEITIPPFFV
jgi:hypothetical protein